MMEWWVVAALGAAGVLGAGFWLGKMAVDRPDSFRKKIESRADKAAKLIKALKLTGPAADEMLQRFIDTDLTAQAHDALGPVWSRVVAPRIESLEQRVKEVEAKLRPPAPPA